MEMYRKFYSEEAVKELINVENVVSSENPEVKKAVPHFLLWAEEERVASAFGKDYAERIRKGKVFGDRASYSYLELAYPKEEASEQKFNMFFDSMAEMAATYNRFTGVFLISLENWKEASPDSPRFAMLMEYVLDHVENVRFIFLVSPKAKYAKRIEGTLIRTLDVKQIRLPLPDLDAATAYVVERLNEAGVELPKRVVPMVGNLISKLMREERYKGIVTLERVIGKLMYLKKSDKDTSWDRTLKSLEEQLEYIPEETVGRIGFLK